MNVIISKPQIWGKSSVWFNEDEYFSSEWEYTFEEKNWISCTLSSGTLYSCIQVSGDSRKNLLDRFWIPVLQSLVIVTEHFVILEIISKTMQSSKVYYELMSPPLEWPKGPVDITRRKWMRSWFSGFCVLCMRKAASTWPGSSLKYSLERLAGPLKPFQRWLS